MTQPSLYPPPGQAGAFVGWLRVVPRGRWQPVCEAPSRSACWDRLLRVERDGLGSQLELLVKPQGVKP